MDTRVLGHLPSRPNETDQELIDSTESGEWFEGKGSWLEDARRRVAEAAANA